jgi:hypothetical protein
LKSRFAFCLHIFAGYYIRAIDKTRIVKRIVRIVNE